MFKRSLSKNIFRFALNLIAALSFYLPVAYMAYAIPGPGLSDADRSSLRYRLENLYNEADLSIRNHRSDELDLARQDRIANELKIYERIPFSPRVDEIRTQLTESAKEAGLRLREFKDLSHTSGILNTLLEQSTNFSVPPLPLEIYTDEKDFRLLPAHIAETVRFRIAVEGDRNKIHDWVRSWPETVMRVIEPEGGVRSPLLEPLSWGRWQIEGWGFRFRRIHFPKLKLRNPRALLPDWAQRNTTLFARAEPVLWNLVEKTDETAPQAGTFMPIRERLLLNDARMNFFILKAGAPK